MWILCQEGEEKAMCQPHNKKRKVRTKKRRCPRACALLSFLPRGGVLATASGSPTSCHCLRSRLSRASEASSLGVEHGLVRVHRNLGTASLDPEWRAPVRSLLGSWCAAPGRPCEPALLPPVPNGLRAQGDSGFRCLVAKGPKSERGSRALACSHQEQPCFKSPLLCFWPLSPLPPCLCLLRPLYRV